MNTNPPVIEIQNLSRRYAKLEAVNGLSLSVRPGKCYGFFGRNGAGKTTTIKCLLNLLRPDSGTVRVFGIDPRRDEVGVKSRLSYVPDMVAFYPWMTVSGVLEYLASFRKHWNRDIEADLLNRFHLDPKQKASHLSKGQRTQLALIGAICPEPELLLLDEPTSGLDPIVRREFIQTVIGAYQSGAPERRTVFVSTHLISEFEGLIDEFTIIEQGRELLTMEADAARARFRKIRARFSEPQPRLNLAGAFNVKQNGRETEILANGNSERLLAELKSHSPEDLVCESLSLEEIFVASDVLKKATPMNMLEKKEVRLLMPAFCPALLIVSAIWLLPEDRPRIFPAHVAEGSLLLGATLLLALAAFGREFSGGTFSIALAQPVPRALMWRTKIAPLAVMMGAVWFVWCIFWLCHHPEEDTSLDDLSNIPLFTFSFTLAIFSGGLWTALLLRQMAASLWFTLLLPAAICMIPANVTDHPLSPLWIDAALLVYAAGGFLFAARLFAQAQDADWTGGHVRVPALVARTLLASGIKRKQRPLLALVMKELQMHQSQFLMAGVLLLFHVATVIVRKCWTFPRTSSALALLESFWALWLLMPLLVGCAAAAEERKIGTLGGQLCLPVKRRTQFVIKFFVVAALSIALGGGAPLLFEASRIQPVDFWKTVGLLAAACAGIGVIAFFVSTLVRNTLQALAPAVLMIIALVYLARSAYLPEQFVRFPLWRGLLIYIITGPSLLGTLVALACRNYKQLSPGWAVWRKNLAALAGVMAMSVAVTAGIYQRPWELVTPLEPAHGAGRIKPGEARIFFTSINDHFSIVLPDGRAWLGIFGEDDRGNPKGYSAKFIEGHNWAQLAACGSDVVGIQRDGTLWVSEMPYNKGFAHFTTLVSAGDEHDWKSLFVSRTSAFLLKNDGTLWYWGGAADWDWDRVWPGLRTLKPVQIGTDSDWKDIFRAYYMPHFRKANGEVWSLVTNWAHASVSWDKYKGPKIVLNKDISLGRTPELDKDAWNSMFECGTENVRIFDMGLRADGSLAELGSHDPSTHSWRPLANPASIGSESDWLQAGCFSFWDGVVSLKADGTLWRWNFKTLPEVDPHSAAASLLGEHSDWVDIATNWASNNRMIALAGDGSLWLWKFESPWFDSSSYHPLLRESRRPHYLGNIFDAEH